MITNLNKYKNKGFTFVELLVVISIIGLLSSIILAALQGARTKGQLASVIEFDTYNYHKLGANIVADYEFDNASNPGLDSSGNGYNLTVVNNPTYVLIDPTSSPSGSGSSLKLLKSYINSTGLSGSLPTINLIGSGSSGLTISLWSKINSNTSNSVLFEIDNSNGGTGYDQLRCMANGSMQLINLWGFPTNIFNSSAVCSDIGNWHNLTISYNYLGNPNVSCPAPDEGLLSIYVDGKEMLTNSCNGFIRTKITSLSIGNGIIMNNLSPFIGNIDGFKIYSDLLTASAIQQLYAEGQKVHPNLAQK